MPVEEQMVPLEALEGVSLQQPSHFSPYQPPPLEARAYALRHPVFFAAGQGAMASGQAREMIPVPQHGGMWVADAGAQEPLVVAERREQEKRMRLRVIGISAAIAGYCVICHVLYWALESSMVYDIIRQTREAEHMSGATPNLGLMAISRLPQVSMSIALALLVPMCGFFGARNNNSCLLSAFTCCSCLSCFCGLIVLLTMTFGIGFVTTGTQSLEMWLDHCDPSICLPSDSGNLTQQRMAVDCLAAGVWGAEYHREYPDRRAYPVDCAINKGWLDCVDGRGQDYPGGFGDEGVGFDEQEEYRKRVEERGGTASSPGHAWTERRLAVAWLRGGGGGDQRMTVSSSSSQEFHHSGAPRIFGGRRGETKQPADVFASCYPLTKDIQDFHAFKEVLPSLAPRICWFIFAEAILTIPQIVLCFLGFCWSKALYNQILARPYLVGAQNPAEVMLQPVFASVVASPQPTDQTMAQPLMLSPPAARGM